MKLFSKLKDYNNLLEEILDKKTFSSISKSLLLSMIYKIEIAYKDYTQIKVNSISKDEFLSNILNIVQKYCDHIKTVEPDSAQAELLIKHKVDAVTNEKERSILVYPTEQAMLYAICDIEPKYFFVKKDFLLKNVLQKVLVSGYKQNTVEILENFNGWSWDISSKEQENYIVNLIYQNLIMIMGEQFLFDWRTDKSASKDYLLELKRSLKSVTGNDNYYLSLCKLLYLIANRNDKTKIKKQLAEKELEYQKFLQKSEEFRKKNVREFNQLKTYHQIVANEKTAYEELLELQKCFLKFIKRKIERLVLREEIVEIICQLRYYQNIMLLDDVLVKENADLAKNLDYVLKMAITKACKMGVIKIISMDIDTNFELLKYILDTRMIDLEEIKIYVELEKNSIYIKVYDKEVFEKQFREDFSGNKKDIVIRKKKMVRLFN